MANKIYWCGEIPAEVTWLTFADQTKENKGYKYNNDFTQISAFTDNNNSLPYDDIKFVVDYNSNVNSRYCKVKFTQKGDKGDKIGYCYISQNGTDFEQLWKHVSKKSDAVIAQSHNETMNPYEVAVGNFNRTRGNLLFSVGNGKDENHRGNSFEVDDEKISADKAYITDLTADTFNATTLNAANIVNGSGADFVSYSSATKNTDTGLYPIGILTINTKKNVIYGKRDKDIENEVRNLSANTVTKEEFKHYRDSSASGLTDEFSAFTTKFDTLSGTIKEEIKNINLLARTATSNTLSLSETVTDYYDELTGKVSGVSKSYNELSQTLTGLTDRIGHVETKYDDVSGQIQSVSSITDDFKVSLSGLSNDVSANTRQYNTLNGTVSGLTDSYSKLEQNLSGLTESVGRVETKYDGLSGKIQSVSSVTDDFKVSLSGLSNDVSANTRQYNTLNGTVSGLTDSYSKLEQNLSGLTESVGRVETKYDGLSGKIQSVSSVTDNFKVSYSGLSNDVSAITKQYDTLNDQVVSNTQNIGTLSATSETFSSKIEQTVSSITLSVQEESKNKLLKTGIDIENGKITLNADNTTVKGDFKVSAVNKADGITLINEKGEPAIMLMTQPINGKKADGSNNMIFNVQNGKFAGTAPIRLSWGTLVLTPYYNKTINTQVCYIEAGKQYKIENMNMSIDLDGAGSLNLINIQLSEGGTVLKTISDAQFNTQSHGLSTLNGTYTATHTGSVVLSMTFTTNFTRNGSHPFINVTGKVTRDSSSIIAFGEGGFAMGLDTNKYMSFDKINGLTVVNNKDGIRLNEYGLTRFRQSDKGYITYVGEAHNIYHFEGTNGWIDLESVRARAYDTILCTGSKDCNIRLGYSDAYPLVDGMAINIIDKCKKYCRIDFAGKPLYKANDTDPTTFGANDYYELDGHRAWKFIYSAAVDAWIEIASNR